MMAVAGADDRHTLSYGNQGNRFSHDFLPSHPDLRHCRGRSRCHCRRAAGRPLDMAALRVQATGHGAAVAAGGACGCAGVGALSPHDPARAGVLAARRYFPDAADGPVPGRARCFPARPPLLHGRILRRFRCAHPPGFYHSIRLVRRRQPGRAAAQAGERDARAGDRLRDRLAADGRVRPGAGAFAACAGKCDLRSGRQRPPGSDRRRVLRGQRYAAGVGPVRRQPPASLWVLATYFIAQWHIARSVDLQAGGN